MNNKIRIGVVGVTAVTWLGSAYLLGLPDTLLSAARPFLFAVGAAGFTYYVYDKLFWRLPFFRNFVSETPVLRGVWQVEIQSTWTDPDTNEVKPLISGFAQIDQTASEFCMRVFTVESRSKTVAHAFEDDHGIHKLAIVYENQPNIHKRANKSALHQGSASFSIRGSKPENFEGEYWTERKNVGTIRLLNRRNGEINSYQEGAELYSTPN